MERSPVRGWEIAGDCERESNDGKESGKNIEIAADGN